MTVCLEMEVSENLIHRIHSSFTGGGVHFATPVSSSRANEFDLVVWFDYFQNVGFSL